MPVVVLFLIFVLLLVIAVPVSITLGITSVLPSICDPSFTVGAKYLIRAMFGGLDSFPLLAVPMFVLSGIIMAKGGISKKLFDVFAYFLGKFTAGMPCAVIVTCLFYGAISGSAPATVAAEKIQFFLFFCHGLLLSGTCQNMKFFLCFCRPFLEIFPLHIDHIPVSQMKIFFVFAEQSDHRGAKCKVLCVCAGICTGCGYA